MPQSQVIALEKIPAGKQSSILDTLVRRIKADIKSRKLRYGDRYLTNTEICQILGVSAATADRAMRHLADKDILVRSRGRGTFIGPRYAPPEKLKNKTILVFQADDQERFVIDRIVDLYRGTEGVGLQVNLVPSGRSIEYIENLIANVQASLEIKGIIAISFADEVYCLLQNTSLPVAVIGSIDNDQIALPRIDVDYCQAGRLLTEYYIRRGHRKFAVLLETENRPGTFRLCDGVLDGLAKYKLAPNAVVIRSFSTNLDVYETQLSKLFNSGGAPTAIIAQGELAAKTTLMLLNKMGITGISNHQIGFVGYRITKDECPFVIAAPVLDLDGLIQKVFGMLESGPDKGWGPNAKEMLIPTQIIFNGEEVALSKDESAQDR